MLSTYLKGIESFREGVKNALRGGQAHEFEAEVRKTLTILKILYRTCTPLTATIKNPP